MLPALEEEAAERKRAGQARGGKAGGRGRNSIPEEIPESYPDDEDADTNEARTQAAELVGTNPRGSGADDYMPVFQSTKKKYFLNYYGRARVYGGCSRKRSCTRKYRA